MFTGIVQKVGTVRAVNQTTATSLDLILDNPFAGEADAVELGESIANSGVCLTVTKFSKDELKFNVAPETLLRTSLSRLKPGSKVNLERSLRMGDRLSGHWVQGHVDGVAKLVDVSKVTGQTPDSSYFDMTFEFLDSSLLKYCVKKGSISVEGISLTIHELMGARLKFQIIPHTWNHTNLVDLKNGDLANIEVDLVAKYIERFEQFK